MLDEVSVQTKALLQLQEKSKNKNLYKDYRWAYLDRNKPDNTHQDIGKTIEMVVIKKGFVAMLNLDKNLIENILVNVLERLYIKRTNDFLYDVPKVELTDKMSELEL